MAQKLAALKTPLTLRDMASPITRWTRGERQEQDRNVSPGPRRTGRLSPAGAAHLDGGKRRQGEEFGHPQLKVEAEAVQDGPDVDHLAGAQPQGGDGEGAQRGEQLSEDLIVIAADVVVDVPAEVPKETRQNGRRRRLTLDVNTHLQSQSLMPRSKCLKPQSQRSETLQAFVVFFFFTRAARTSRRRRRAW